MSRSYTEKEFLEMAADQKAWKGDDIYRQSFVNYKGVTNDTKKYYTEILAEKIYNDEIVISPAPLDYSKEKVSNGYIHQIKDVKYNDTNRNEENIAKRLFELSASFKTGSEEYKVVDYQVPVYRVDGSSHGKVDLILETKSLTVLCELKDNHSEESLLRTVLEVETYFQKMKMKYPNNNLGKSIFIFEKTRPYEEYREESYLFVKKLISRFDICMFVVKQQGSSKYPKDNRYFFEKINDL